MGRLAMFEIMCEYHKRGAVDRPAHGHPFQSLIDANYCLDAPEIMPAGSVVSEQWIEGEFMPMPSFVDRQSVTG